MSERAAAIMTDREFDAAKSALEVMSRRGFRFYSRKPGIRGRRIDLLGAYSRGAEEFFGAICGCHLQIPFDWIKWQKQAAAYYRNPSRLKKASMLTLRKLLTLHMRKERFVTGHMEGMIQGGYIQAILKWIVSFAPSRTCPKCGSKRVIPILWGMPSPEAEREADKGRVYLAGCVMLAPTPEWHCVSCRHQWGFERGR